MANRELAGVVSQIQQMAAGGCGPSDTQVLERFIAARDDAAFELLVRRHERLVFGVCRRMLPDFRDAEDAFQAVFLALARKAHGIAKREALAAWLYRVAFRTAVTARSRWARHAGREQPLDDSSVSSVPVEPNGEMAAHLDEELRRLPERLRTPIILCFLEGRTVDEAARELGCPRGTVASRLARAKAKLRWRLARRGLAVPAAAITSVVAAEAPAAESHALVGSAVRVAQWWNSGHGTVADGISARVIALSHEVLRAMSIKKLTNVALMALATAGLLIAGGALGLHRNTGAAEPGEPQQPKPAAAKPKAEKDPPAAPDGPLVSKPVPREAAPFADYSGRLEAALSVDLVARSSGRLESIACKAGAEVKKGQVLFEIETTGLKENVMKAEANLKLAEGKLKVTNASYLQLKELYDNNKGLSYLELQRAYGAVVVDEAQVNVAKIDVERARREFDATRVTAPYDGTVGRIQVSAGSHVTAEKTVLASVMVLHPMQVVFEMDQNSFLRYQRLLKEEKVKKEGYPLLMELGDKYAPEDQMQKGQLTAFGDRFDPAKGTIQVRGLFANTGKDLLPGMFVRVRMAFGPPRRVLEVPTGALMSDENRFYVLVINDKNVERRLVKVLQQDGDRIQIEGGLDKDDWVVIDGAKELRTGDRVEPRRADSTRSKKTPEE
jgi:RND family efflux transporter MFP subunit